jgi:hypothetical protein
VSLRLADYGVDLPALAAALQERRKRKASAERVNEWLIDVRDWSQLEVPEIVARFRAEPLSLLAAWEVTHAADYLDEHNPADSEFLLPFYEPQFLRRLAWLSLAPLPEEPPELPLAAVLADNAPWAGLRFLHHALRWAERFAHLPQHDLREFMRINLAHPFLAAVHDGQAAGEQRLLLDLLAQLGIPTLECKAGLAAPLLTPWLIQHLGLREPPAKDAQRRLNFIEAGGTPRSLFVVRAIGGVDGFDVRGVIGEDLGLIIDIGDREVSQAATAYIEGHVVRVINAFTPLTAELAEGSLRLRWYDTSLSAEEMGRQIYAALKQEFTLKVVSVNVIFDAMRINSLRPGILAYREERGRQLAKRTEENSPFLACRACQVYAPHAFCVVSVDRPPCCGRGYDELATLAQLTTHMEQFTIEPGVCRDRQRGSYMGADKTAQLLTDGKVQQLNLHSLREKPHPTTAIPQCIAYYIEELDLICVCSSDYTGRTPDGKTFGTLLARTAGRQTPGFAGISEAYVLSPRFFTQEGGLSRVGWMNSSLKQRLKLKIEHIATELECTNMNGLRDFVARGRS